MQYEPDWDSEYDSGQLYEPDDFETLNQNEADDYRHEFDGEPVDEADDAFLEAQYEERYEDGAYE